MMTVAEGGMKMFEREKATYEAHKAELLQFEGQLVVIRGDEILGHYPTTAEAFAAGIAKYGPEQFFMHKISKDEPGLFNPFIGSMSGVQARYPI